MMSTLAILAKQFKKMFQHNEMISHLSPLVLAIICVLPEKLHPAVSDTHKRQLLCDFEMHT